MRLTGVVAFFELMEGDGLCKGIVFNGVHEFVSIVGKLLEWKVASSEISEPVEEDGTNSDS
jgi:hypothetical protein